jgi:hypothetical protein
MWKTGGEEPNDISVGKFEPLVVWFCATVVQIGT